MGSKAHLEKCGEEGKDVPRHLHAPRHPCCSYTAPRSTPPPPSSPSFCPQPLGTPDEHPGCNAAHAAALALPLRSFHAWLNAAPGSAFPTTSLCKQLPRKNHLIIIFAPSSRRCCWSRGSLQPQKASRDLKLHECGTEQAAPTLHPLCIPKSG